MIGQRVSHYKILKKLGEGGMGVVYKAQDTKLKRTVALKFLPPDLTLDREAKNRFLHEAQAASALQDNNICAVYEIDKTDDGVMFISMEYLEGETLKTKIEHGRLPVEQTIDIAIQIAQGLMKAHERRIIHRDIKPANIVITVEGTVKIVDFGLAKLSGATKLTKAGTTLGTVAYMSPEQLRGDVVDVRADIFSLGAVIFEMLARRTPFKGDHHAAMIYSILNVEPDSIEKYRSDVPPVLVTLVQRALEKHPDDRYQSMKDVIIELRRIVKRSAELSRTLLPVALSREDSSQPSSDKMTPTVERIGSHSLKMVIGGRSRKMFLIIGGASTVAGIFFTMRVFDRSAELNPNMSFRVLQFTSEQIGKPGLSFDGKWIAVPAADTRHFWYVYYMNSSFGEAHRVTTEDWQSIHEADISPDGSEITFDCENQRFAQWPDLKIVSSLGGATKTIAERGDCVRWRPDGQRMGYISSVGTSKSGKMEFWTVGIDGTDRRLEFIDSTSEQARVWGENYPFAWKPNGEAIAWPHTYPEQYQEILIHDLVSRAERQLTFDKKNVGEVCWTSNDQIIYSSNRGGNVNLWMVPASGGKPVQITKGGGPDIGVKVSADLKKAVYLQDQTVDHLWSAPIDGSWTRQVTFGDHVCLSPSLSPDGKRIAFIMADEDPMRQSSLGGINVIDRDGNNRKQLSSSNMNALWPVWSPDGKWIAFSTHALNTPTDSEQVYLIDAMNPGSPRFIGWGRLDQWADDSTLIVLRQKRSWSTYISGGQQKQFYEDSTFAYPFLAGKYIVYSDQHSMRKEGLWIVPAEHAHDHTSRWAKRILSEAELDFVVWSQGPEHFFIDPRWVVWRVSYPEGRREVMHAHLPEVHTYNRQYANLSFDGKEIVYADYGHSSKLVLIENLFK